MESNNVTLVPVNGFDDLKPIPSPELVKYLEDSKARIPNIENWTTEVYAKDRFGANVHESDDRATCWCAYGSIRATKRDDGLMLYSNAISLLRRVSRELGFDNPPELNDSLGWSETGHARVMEMFDIAIGYAKGEAHVQA